MVTSASGGGGKTMLALGLARAFARRGLAVKPFKKGPDYIDAAWLGLAAGRPAANLDPFFMDPSDLRNFFSGCMAALPDDSGRLAIVEGNRGLYDGLDAGGSCSSAAVARALGLPLIICLDCTKMTRTAAALLTGLCHFESGLDFAGIVLNRVGSVRHERSLLCALAGAGLPPVLGCLPRLADNPLPERRMGLASAGPGLARAAGARLDCLGRLVEERLDLDLLLRLAACPAAAPAVSTQARAGRASGPRIGYVRDGALWFHYPENLHALHAAGAQLQPLAIVGSDGRQVYEPERWRDLDGLYLGGGFPEDLARALSASQALARIRELAALGMPIYAECGGLLLLVEDIAVCGERLPMARVFKASAVLGDRPAGLGYVEAEVCGPNPFYPEGFRFRGHEFHYTRCRARGEATSLLLKRGHGLGGGRDGLTRGGAFASYTHVFAPALPCWAPNFVAAARAWRSGLRAAEDLGSFHHVGAHRNPEGAA